MKIKFTPRLRVFLRFYLFWLLAALALYYSVLVIRNQVTQTLTHMIQYKMMQKTISSIEEHMRVQPQQNWHEDIQKMNSLFSFPLSIEKTSNLRERINKEDYQALVKDGGLFIHDGFIYKIIKGTDEVLLIGPIIATLNDNTEGLSGYEIQLLLFEWGGTIILSFIFSYIWLRPVWNSVNNLRGTAQALSRGDLTARASPKQSYLVRPIALALNSMAEKVQQFVALRQEMSHTMAHELRTPIARIRFHLSNYLESNTIKSDVSDINKVYQELDEVETLISMALNYARFESDSVRIHPRKQYASTWLEEQVSVSYLNDRRVDVELHFSDDLGWIEIDTKIMPYITQNLLSNAKKYAKKVIYLSAERVGDRLFIVVEDDGRGINPADYGKIFLPFYRGKVDEESGISGFGLGLSIAQRVAKLHQGSISVTRSDELGGAKFTLEFPCKYHPPATT
ncbi:two-component sensor histidine kinase [Yersinia mollaretii]|uniref:histidine kinase n=1 Tax=Yersinia mollaretii TaxID=33060 RepID=A0AA44CPD0_YERMO|nr:ATP-binding protein [Yersinia mollaretii]NIL24260.1 two-component sensor histidine kinase [Yersinia mollaretii]CNJ22134.1 sensor protein RstB [Yersinia mollaretii]CQR09459.1 sensor protein RstB [Yersinia mollaretii]